MRPLELVIGARYGRLIVKGIAERIPNQRRRQWECTCDCGNTARVNATSLASGAIQSCGCLQRETAATTLRTALTTHGQSATVTYRIWKGMITRCVNPANHAWQYYGGRGIKVCERWMKFENFLADMGPRPAGLSLERENNDGNYEPGNCKWATDDEQANNNRHNRWITHNGETLTLSAWAERLGILRSSLHGRIARQGVERALSGGKRR
jgi:hypothetical protein